MHDVTDFKNIISCDKHDINLHPKLRIRSDKFVDDEIICNIVELTLNKEYVVYASVLNMYKNLTILSLQSAIELDEELMLLKLETLVVHLSEEIMTLNVFKHSLNLTSLTIHNVVANHIEGIHHFTKLKYLYVYSDTLDSLEGVQHLQELESAVLFLTCDVQCEALTECKKLKTLHLCDCHDICMDQIFMMSSLETLIISHSFNYIDCVKENTTLKHLSILKRDDYDNQIGCDLSDLKNLLALETLTVDANYIYSVDTLLSLPQLKKVSLYKFTSLKWRESTAMSKLMEKITVTRIK